MNGQDQVACAHSRVVLKHTDNPDGTRSDYWECESGCGCKFVPAIKLQWVENDYQASDKLNSRLMAACHDYRKALEWLWAEDEMGYITSGPGKPIECVMCGRKGMSDKEIVHEEYCAQGVIYKALYVRSSVVCVTLEEAEKLALALEGCNEMFDTYGHTSESPCARDKEIVKQMLEEISNWRNKHPKE